MSIVPGTMCSRLTFNSLRQDKGSLHALDAEVLGALDECAPDPHLQTSLDLFLGRQLLGPLRKEDLEALLQLAYKFTQHARSAAAADPTTDAGCSAAAALGDCEG